MADLQSLKQPFRHFTYKAKGDKYIWSCVLLLALASVLVVYSSTGTLAYKMYKGNTEVYLFRQLSFIVFGLLLIYFLHNINYKVIFSRLALYLYIISIPLLAYTTFNGTSLNEGSRWIMLPVINMSFQTSDFAKVALFMYLSRQLSRKQNVIKNFKEGFLPLVVPVALTCALIMPANLSNALLTGATSLILLFIGRAHIKHLLLVIGIALLPVILIIAIAVSTYTGKTTNGVKELSKTKVSETLTSMGRFGTWVSRIQDFMYAKDDAVPYQVQQANIAIANGSIFYGLGPGKSRQRNFLPQAYNDFIYSIIIEEYGLIGGAFILFIYMVFLFRCINIFRRCPYAFGAFLALGLSFSMVIQALANMAVNVNLTPVTGVTLPLVSMGGTSFLFTCAAIGIILGVARNVEQLEGKNTEPPPEENDTEVKTSINTSPAIA